MAGIDAGGTLPAKPDRRGFLYAATIAAGAVGVIGAAWPLIDHLNPDAATRANGDFVEIDTAAMAPGEQRVARWHLRPIFVVRRTDAMLAAMRDPAFAAMLRDPQSVKRQQPDYARNWHRSIAPGIAVLVGVCTYCACIPRFVAEDASPDVAGGYVCPCCASHYDPAGRAFSGPTQYNLAVPPYVIAGPRVVVGKNPPGELFSFTSIERT